MEHHPGGLGRSPRACRAHVRNGHRQPVHAALAADVLHHVMDARRGGHRTDKLAPAIFGTAREHRHPDDEAQLVLRFLQQLERCRRHDLAAFAAVLHGGQVGRLGADVQPHDAFVAFVGPEVVGHEILGALARRVNGKVGVTLGAQRSVGPHPRLERFPLGGQHQAGERQVLEPRVTRRHFELAHGLVECGTAHVGLRDKQPAQAEDDFGVGRHMLLKGIGKLDRPLLETGLLCRCQRCALHLVQPCTGQQTHHGNRQPGKPGPQGKLARRLGHVQWGSDRCRQTPAQGAPWTKPRA